MSNNEIAFFVGLFGSIHCIGMCGPLAFAIPVIENKWWLIVADKVLYNLGRIVTYTLLGLLIGFIGRQLWIFGLQQFICVISGILIVLAAISRIFKLHAVNTRFIAKFFLPVNRLLAYALQHHGGHFVIGLINGLLPCGFVYLALVGAINTSTPSIAGKYMFWFGAGTFPLMLIATVSSGFITPRLRNKINKGIPYIMIILGCWFIVRGLGINIPYLSPKNPSHGIGICD